jgi:putative tricarboxylic transport membrane protein
MQKENFYSSIFFFLVGIAFTLGSLKFSIWDRYGPGAAFFPFVLGMILCILSLILFLNNVGTGKKEKSPTAARSDRIAYSNIRKVVQYLIFLVCFYFIFEWVGFVLTIFIFIATAMIFVSKRGVKMALISSILFAVITYLLFSRLLNVTLPDGRLINLIKGY